MILRRAPIVVALHVAIALLSPAQAPAAVAETPIQPGAKIFSPVGQCTMNFVFEDAADDLYVGTAGHCTTVGDRVVSEAGPFGWTVYSVRTTVKDFALIKIDAARYGEVSRAMRFWGGPTGVTTPTETLVGEPLLQYGHGIGFGQTEPSRRRLGPMSNDSFTRYRGFVPSIFGDSGSPVLHGPTGKALGVAVELTFGAGLSGGPTIQAILADLAEAGFDVRIRTAPFAFPPDPE